jgi:hypothetical protein
LRRVFHVRMARSINSSPGREEAAPAYLNPGDRLE